MAQATVDNVLILRRTAKQIALSHHYEWGHMGSCNCGFLAQEITKLTKAQIHSSAMMGHGDWNEQLNDYCPTSGLPFDGIISTLLAQGFDIDDLKHLERLSDPLIVESIGCKLQHNKKEDVIMYLMKWAEVLEESLLKKIEIKLLDVQIA